MLHKLPNSNLISSGLILLAPTVSPVAISGSKYLHSAEAI